MLIVGQHLWGRQGNNFIILSDRETKYHGASKLLSLVLSSPLGGPRVFRTLLKHDFGRLTSARIALTLFEVGDLEELHADHCCGFREVRGLAGLSLLTELHIVIPMVGAGCDG